MFRFCILSILCVYVTASAAFAHPDPGQGYHFGTTRGIELRVGGNNRERFIGQTDPDDDGYHYHRYSYTIFLQGGSVGLIWEKLFQTDANPSDPDDLPDDYFPAIGGDQTPVTPPPLPQQVEHSHEVRHQHGNYVRHKHTVTHTGASSHHTHTYTDAEVHAVDGDHSGVGTVPSNNNPQQLIQPPPKG